MRGACEVQLGECTAPVRKVDPKRVFGTTAAFPYVDLSAVDQDRKAIRAATTVPGAEAPSRARQVIKAGDILVSTVRPNLNAVAQVTRRHDGAIASTGFTVLRPTDRVESGYLFHWVRTPAFVQRMVREATGASYPAVSDRIVKLSTLRLPPIADQRRIARALDAADALRAKRRDALRWLDRLPGTLFHEMFGTATAEGAAWPRVPLSTIIQRAEGGRSFAGEDEKDRTARHRVLRVSAVTSNRFRPAESRPVPNGYEPPQAHVVRDGDLLFSRANTSELVGAVALVENPPENLLLPDKLWRLVWQDPNTMSPEFVWQLLQSPPVRGAVSQRATGTSGSMKNISAERLLSISVIHPPPALQTQFGERYRTIRLLQARAEAHLTHLDALFASLQSRAFKGEL